MNKLFIAGASALAGAVTAIGLRAKIAGPIEADEVNHWMRLSEKHLMLMHLFDQWVRTKQEGKSIVDYFHKNGIKSIAIYGMHYAGERLYQELKDSDIEIKCAIDKSAKNMEAGIAVISPDEQIPEVDAIIVTAVYFFEDIQEKLMEKTEAEIIALDDLLCVL